ncbi:MAG: signal peptidase I [Terrimicrobiaceae bacterium]
MLFTPRYIKEGKHYRHALQRLIHYKEDILPPKDLATLRGLLADLQAALKSRSREKLQAVRDQIEKQVGRIAPPPSDAGWRENVEVFLVAIVIAAGVRAYFLQPFKIPTGSMQPTLFGIVGKPMDTPPPNLLIRAFQMVWLGRHYVDLKAKDDEVVQEVHESTYLNFFTFTQIGTDKNSYRLFAPRDTLQAYFGVGPGRSYQKGEPIARGSIDTGDQVFVDKMSYNFLNPRRGDVFVFKTTGILGIRMPPGIESQHYIKRLAGLPGDTLRIDAPKLFIDGKEAQESVFQRVMSCQNGYRGYSDPPGALYLSNPAETFTLPPKTYFALGDNSYQSSDSRYWGVVPEQNVAGKGLFVYWPFSKRWGLIR